MKFFKLYSILAIILISLSISAQDKQYKSFVVGFYNLENLFDTINDPTKNDEQFLPDGSYAWGTMKYVSKLEKMAYAISQFPANLALLGVSEIENIDVLEDLVKEETIAARGLKPILVEGPDRRSVDVGLLYNPRWFTPTNITSTTVKTEIERFITRDQLCVTGLLDGEEVHMIVLHWPSRGGGLKRSNPRRADAAITTKSICDSILNIDPKAKIFIVGDLNDDPVDDSVVKHLGAKTTQKATSEGELFNTTAPLYKKGIGSLAYQDKWNLFDQIIVSHEVLGDDRSTLKYWKTEIFNKDFLTQQEGRYKGFPLRTHSGGVWTNGYSDHYPSLMWLVKEVK